jgi:perosamine synthetase
VSEDTGTLNHIPLFKVMMVHEAVGRVGQTLMSGFIGQGERVDEFEREMSKFTPYPIVAMNSCTSSIHAVLIHLGVGPGDEVITTPLTCIATNAPILALGARPVWADVDKVTGNIDPVDVARKITKRTKAIIAVNWTGRPCDYKTLKQFGIPVIEDAAHGPLTLHTETGHYICYSYGPIKHFTTGDGGAVATADEEDREALSLIRWYGLDRTSGKDFRCEQNIVLPGMKFHMNDINASIGLGNLPNLRWTVQRHQKNVRELYDRLSQVAKKNNFFWLPPWSDESNYWVFPIHGLFGFRDRLKQYLNYWGVHSSQVHARGDKHTAYHFPNGRLPGLDSFDQTQLNLPCGWWLKPSDIEQIVHTVAGFNG